MARRAELLMVAGALTALGGAAILGSLAAPKGDLADPRHSARLTGPAGLHALTEVLARLGTATGERTHAFFDLGRDSAPSSGDTLFAIIAPPHEPTWEEAKAIRAYVARGGRVLLAGTRVMACFGYRSERLYNAPPRQPWATAPLTLADRVLRARETGEHCGGRAPIMRSEALWIDSLTRDTIAIALASGAGEVILVADADVFTNRALKEHRQAATAVTWLQRGATRVVVFDEHHQGFGTRASLLGTTWRFARGTPAGAMLIQLALAGAALVWLGAVRFGPPVAVVARQRRRPLEHVDALAAGLDRARADGLARRLIAQGLHRRLAGGAPPSGGRLDAWLETLERGARSDTARAAAQRLRHLLTAPGDGRTVALTAHAVEDVWDSLKPQTRRTRS